MQLLCHSSFLFKSKQLCLVETNLDLQARCDPGAGVWRTLQCSWKGGSSHRTLLIQVLSPELFCCSLVVDLHGPYVILLLVIIHFFSILHRTGLPLVSPAILEPMGLPTDFKLLPKVDLIGPLTPYYSMRTGWICCLNMRWDDHDIWHPWLWKCCILLTESVSFVFFMKINWMC